MKISLKNTVKVYKTHLNEQKNNNKNVKVLYCIEKIVYYFSKTILILIFLLLPIYNIFWILISQTKYISTNVDKYNSWNT